MVDAQMRTEVLQIFDEFTPAKREEALEILRTLRRTNENPPIGSGEALLRHAGRISYEDGILMEKVIEESCERIDPRDWQLPR